MNALSAQAQDEIAAAAGETGADPAIRAVVVYGGTRGGSARNTQFHREWAGEATFAGR
jgi:enoyl-CoA hydratase/carnithine racemase